jgi:hypothetical protein
MFRYPPYHKNWNLGSKKEKHAFKNRKKSFFFILNTFLEALSTFASSAKSRRTNDVQNYEKDLIAGAASCSV